MGRFALSLNRAVVKKFTAIFSIMCLFACAHSASLSSYKDLVLSTYPSPDPDEILESAQLTEDIHEALFALERSYVGSDVLPPAQFLSLLRKIESITGNMSAHQLCQRIEAELDQIPDSHLNAHFLAKSCSSHPAAEGQVGRNSIVSERAAWAVSVIKVGTTRALQIAIQRFPDQNSPIWNGFLNKVSADIGGASFVILDLRGNEGGDDAMGFKLARLLLNREPQSPRLIQAVYKETPEAVQVQLNRIDLEILENRTKHDQPSDYLIKLKQKYTEVRNQVADKKMLASQLERYVDGPLKTGDSFKPLPGFKVLPIYILIDRETISSGESTVDFFANSAQVKKVGENTGGYIHFGNVGVVALKNSKILLQLATHYNQYRDGSFLEKKGIPPDIQVKPGTDAFKAAAADYFRVHSRDR